MPPDLNPISLSPNSNSNTFIPSRRRCGPPENRDEARKIPLPLFLLPLALFLVCLLPHAHALRGMEGTDDADDRSEFPIEENENGSWECPKRDHAPTTGDRHNTAAHNTVSDARTHTNSPLCLSLTDSLAQLAWSR